MGRRRASHRAAAAAAADPPCSRAWPELGGAWLSQSWGRVVVAAG
jgi:hypothetical protein